MSSSSTKLVVVCFTLALLVASYGVAALCEEKVGIPCNSTDDNDTCRTKCLSDYDGRYTGGRCSTENAVNSCVCSKYCGAPGAEPALEKSKARATLTPGRRGMGVLN
ncbi:unnamed protein product [Urochloa decumbens]|uniref:Uncharacterized protein n=1 Tax=Urochloa decumbens TaxID=240449 RepID=A0ABC9B4V5_9POAL